LKLAPGAMADGVSNDAGTWLLGLSGAPIAAIGAWTRAWMLGKRFLEANHKINEALFPTLVERRASGDDAGFDRALFETIRLSSAVMLLPAAVGGGAAVSVMELFGSGFARGADALAVLLVLPAIYGAAALMGLVLLVADRPLVNTYINLGRLALTIACGWPLIRWLGLTGAAVGMLVAFIGNLGAIVVIAKPYLARPWHELWPPRTLLALLVAYGLGFLSARTVDDQLPGIGGLVLALIAGSAVYAAVYILGGGVTADDRARIAGLRRRRRSRAVPSAGNP
jgi:O-antigen/teichoic acid export membrane protein